MTVVDKSEIAERATICKNCQTPITQVQRFQDTSSRWIIQWEHPHGVMCEGLRAEPGERAIAESQAPQPSAYMCPTGCGCLWRDNRDGTMSLFGHNSKSCGFEFRGCTCGRVEKYKSVRAKAVELVGEIAALRETK